MKTKIEGNYFILVNNNINVFYFYKTRMKIVF